MGGFISVKVLGLFEGAMLKHGEYSFTFAAMAGNVGAIISNYCARFGKQHLEWVLI
jgi:hypothetical protein